MKRDQSIDRLLRQALETPEGAATPACLDAETFAAWFDGGLEGAALADAESHASTCARCRSIVSAMARTGDAAARAAAAPEMPAAKPSLRRWLNWAVPLTAAAAAVVIWIAAPGKRTPPTPAEVERQAAVREAPQASTLDERGAAPATAMETQPPPAALKAEDAPPVDSRRDVDQLQADNGTLQVGARGTVGTPSLADRAAARSAPEPAPAAPPAPTAAAAPAAPVELRRQGFSTATAETLAKTAAAPIAIESPDPSIRWRLVGPSVEGSTDGGASWDTVSSSGAGQELTAGSAPSPTTCWVVGRGGTVLVTSDGRNFRRVAFPETADLATVQATDARSAAVTTADGRVFVTTDGGSTWALR